jgi:glycosyltransferase involved in cell wall biosynthesis
VIGAARSYALVSPVRNEAENLRRLAACVREQTVTPAAWVVVDNGSTDDTLAAARELAKQAPWVRVIEVPGEASPQPGAPIVRAFNAGLAALGTEADVVVKLDADVSFAPDYFERHLEAFTADRRLGIAGGACLEARPDGEWREAHVTSDHVRGASRAYRWACLQEVLPLEERLGWDGIDEIKARVYGWRTAILPGVTFRHHRKVGARDGGRRARWWAQGQGSHFMGYRFSYIALRSLRHLPRDPAAIAMLEGYVEAARRRAPRCAEKDIVAALREEQRLRHLPVRALETLGRRPAVP